MCTLCTYKYAHVCVCVYTHVYVSIHMYMCVHIHICKYTHVRVCKHTYIHMYTHGMSSLAAANNSISFLATCKYMHVLHKCVRHKIIITVHVHSFILVTSQQHRLSSIMQVLLDMYVSTCIIRPGLSV